MEKLCEKIGWTNCVEKLGGKLGEKLCGKIGWKIGKTNEVENLVKNCVEKWGGKKVRQMRWKN